jgi:glycosyltransferase involved in cell wall biosynthesis
LISTEDGTDYEFFAKTFNSKKDVKILFNGMDLDLKNRLRNSYNPKKKINGKEFKIIYIGRLSDWKRQDLAVDTLYYLRKKGLNASLTFVGDGPNLGKIEKQVSVLGIERYVNIVYGIPQIELPKLIIEHDLSMFLYNNGNLGNALWESCLAGQLICIRRSGDLKGIFKNKINSIVVESNDSSEQIANSILDALKYREINSFGFRIREEVDLLIKTWEERIELELNYLK